MPLECWLQSAGLLREASDSLSLPLPFFFSFLFSFPFYIISHLTCFVVKFDLKRRSKKFFTAILNIKYVKKDLGLGGVVINYFKLD